MQDNLRIRKELEDVIANNNNNLTDEAVIKKALEAELELSRLSIN